MTLIELLKKIRISKRLKQSEMVTSLDKNSSYSRIENGMTSLKLSQLEEFLSILEITPDEFFYMSYSDKGLTGFLEKFRNVIKFNCNPTEINLLIKDYLPKEKNIEKMTKEQLCFYCVIKNQLSSERQDITPLTKEETNYVVFSLLNNHYYTHYDYTVALNTLKYMSTSQVDKIINSMIPLTDITIRPPMVINTAFNLLTNAITLNVYQKNYKKAWYYVVLADSMVGYTTGYYSKTNLEYSKCIVNRFLNKDINYIDKAKDVIRLTRSIGDDFTANSMEIELKNLMDNPDHYLNVTEYSSVPINE